MHISANDINISGMSSSSGSGQAANNCFCTLYLNGMHQNHGDNASHAVILDSSMTINKFKIEFRNANNEVVDFNGRDVFFDLRLYYTQPAY